MLIFLFRTSSFYKYMEFLLKFSKKQIKILPLYITIIFLTYSMKNLFIATAAILTAFVIISEMNFTHQPTLYDEFKLYLKKFGKSYQNDVEFMYRAKIYENFIEQMKRHNSDSTKSWKMGVNQFSDLTKDQFVSIYLGQKGFQPNKGFKEQPVNAGYAGEIDWRNRGIITPVKNQGRCGSCWAFGATAAHQTYQIQFRNQPKTIVLSEQQLVDCSTGEPYGNTGCNGGYAVRALQYIKDFGQTTNESYPYMAVNQQCKTRTGTFRVYGIAEVTGCSQIENTIVRRPMAVRVDATNWHAYASGIFDNCDAKLNHAVFLVGTAEDHWTIKNSWSATWGQQGYIRLKKGNTCGVCTGPSFPI